jgi:hypothetical protein
MPDDLPPSTIAMLTTALIAQTRAIRDAIEAMERLSRDLREVHDELVRGRRE